MRAPWKPFSYCFPLGGLWESTASLCFGAWAPFTALRNSSQNHSPQITPITQIWREQNGGVQDYGRNSFLLICIICGQYSFGRGFGVFKRLDSTIQLHLVNGARDLTQRC